MAKECHYTASIPADRINDTGRGMIRFKTLGVWGFACGSSVIRRLPCNRVSASRWGHRDNSIELGKGNQSPIAKAAGQCV